MRAIKDNKVSIIRVLLLMILTTALFANCFAEDEEDDNETLFYQFVVHNKSENEKYSLKSICLVSRQRGITKVYRSNELIYTVNEFTQNSWLSNDGQILVLYTKDFNKPLTEEVLANFKLISIYKSGKLVRTFKLKDLFAMNSNVKIVGVAVNWLVSNSDPTKLQGDKSIQISENQIVFSTTNGYDWYIDPDSGKITKKIFNSKIINNININDDKIDKNKDKKALEDFKQIVLADSKYEFSEFKRTVEGYKEDQYFFECHIQYFIDNHHISISVKNSELENLSASLTLIKDVIKAFTTNNPAKVSYSIDCYITDLENYNFSGISKENANSADEAHEFLNNSFMVRESREGEYLDIPYLVKFSINEPYEFTKIRLK